MKEVTITKKEEMMKELNTANEEGFVIIQETTLVNNQWTNGRYELEVYLNKSPETIEEVLYEDDDTKLVYGDTNGFITYGSISKKESFGHRAGYRWSSRASVFNGMFGTMGFDVTYILDGKRRGGCMDVNLVLEFLPDDFYIIEQVETDNEGNIQEITYYITNTEHETNHTWEFGDRTYSSGAKRYIRRRLKEV